MLHRRHGDLLYAGSLFAPEQSTPVEGLLYRPDFLSGPEEGELLRAIAALPLRAAPYRQYTARRRIASFDAIPGFLHALERKVCAWSGLAGFARALVTEYPPGTPLGWHRDSPEYEAVAGVSLGGGARMRFRRYPPQRGARVFDLALAARSAYTLRDEARWGWQHSIAPTPALRYSVTFRTLK
jgi:alkylated DNA repair dioxygenase AlkB